MKVLRTKIKGTGPRKPNSMESPTPNFYEMAFLPDNTTTKNSKHDSEKTQEIAQTVMKTREFNPPGSFMNTVEIASTSPKLIDDVDKSMTWKRNQERMHQIQQLNDLDRDILLLSRASSNIQKCIQAQELCQANLHEMQSSDNLCNTPRWKGFTGPSQSSFHGFNYPLALSVIII